MGKGLNRILDAVDPGMSNDYDDMDYRSDDLEAAERSCMVQVARIKTQAELLEVKDALYAGDIVVANISNPTKGLTEEKILKDLSAVADEIDGDIARRGRSEVIATPRGVTVGREQIGSQ